MDRHPNGKATAVDALSQYAEDLPVHPPLGACELAHPVEYQGYRELLESWASLANSRSQVIGHSRRGEPLWMVEIGNPEATKVSVVIAGIHPIEWIGVETAFQLAKQHSLAPCSDRRVCFFPLVNPDGFRTVEKHLRNKRRRWVRSNDAGVDLNRNWPTHFRKSRGLIAGHNHSGPAALSEPEVAAVVQALDTIDESASIDFALSLHSIGNMVLMPWGGIWKSPKARKRHTEAASIIAKRLGGYKIRQVSRWVPGISFAHGMEIDHLHHRYGATSLLVECTRGQLSWFRPKVLLDPFRIFNPRRGRSQAQDIADSLRPFVQGKL